jgi:hypothetical protein
MNNNPCNDRTSFDNLKETFYCNQQFTQNEFSDTFLWALIESS